MTPTFPTSGVSGHAGAVQVWGPTFYCDDVTDVEALNAAILLRAGASWEAMAYHLEASRQAVHRRLAARGEMLFAAATDSAHDRTTDPDSLIGTYADGKTLLRKGDYDGCMELFSTLGPRTDDQVNNLLAVEDLSNEIFESPRARTDEVLELKKGPGDWMPKV
jgi:hypothetical protein